MAALGTAVVKVKPELDLSGIEAQLAGVAVLRPGDTLVLTTPRGDIADDVVARLRAALPGVELVIVTGVAAAAVYRPESSDPEHR